MPHQTLSPRISLPSLASLAVFVVIGALAAGQPAAGDDRNTLRNSAGNPYVFIMLDTSGSMNWAPPGGTCATGDCYVPLQGDDPGSKIYQAKAALFSVLQAQNAVHFGFATYNQDQLQVKAKHFLYQATTAGPVFNSVTYPAIGAQEVFGATWACDSTATSGDFQSGCVPSNPANLSNAFMANRMKFLPKGGSTFATAVTFYVKSGANTYKVVYAPLAGTLGSATNITTTVTVARCTNASCTSTSGTGITGSPATVTWSLVQDFIAWDNGYPFGSPSGAPKESNPQLTYFGFNVAQDSAINDFGPPYPSCKGWDSNSDSTTTGDIVSYSSPSSTYNLKKTTIATDPRGSAYYTGDVLPWDWTQDHNLDIRKRLAPNLELNAAATPDFTIASYFNNVPWSGQTYLRLPTLNASDVPAPGTKKSNSAPLIAQGGTPIGNSLNDILTWFNTWSVKASNTTTGDPLYKCSKKYVFFITDGDESCQGSNSTSPIDPCVAATNLKNKDITTFILGFGLAAATNNALTCVAANGGSGVPLYPQDQTALINALNSLFGSIAENPTAFASAAVPSVQAETSDKVFLTSFYPLQEAGIWDGHVNAFLKPLPLANGVPDLSRVCSGAVTSSCLLWDSGIVMRGQAPSLTDLASGDYKIGDSTNQRRVFYPQAPVASSAGEDIPRPLRTFTPPAGNQPSADWTDLFNGLNYAAISIVDPVVAQTRATQVIKNTLQLKDANITFTNGSGVTTNFTEKYVLGDIFHSDPIFYSNPDNFLYFTADLYNNNATCTTLASDNPGYRCFAQKNRRRRKMVVVGANDGQLHAFDAGTWDASKNAVSNGTGTEIFAYVPRLALPVLRDQAANDTSTSLLQKTHIFSVDGTVRSEEVFIDPRHSASTGPVAAKREWRSVLIGGFREGGKPNGSSTTPGFISGIYALDVTDPDPVNASFVPTTTGAVPGCLSTATLGTPTAGCGTNPFPSVLWEFTDSITDATGMHFLDEDTAGSGAGKRDLGSTWSVPTVGRIQVTEGGTVVQKSVMIFGGGFDAMSGNGKTNSPEAGAWIYIVDIETGRAIYKKAVSGSVVGNPAIIDSNQDGLLDTIYFGTTLGFVYKMDISSPATLANYVLATSTGRTATNSSFPLAAATTVKRVTSAAWDPLKIFDTGGLPIYLGPTVFFVATLNQYAISFGTGDREDLWQFYYDGSGNKLGYTFNLILDEGFNSSTSGLPRTAANYQNIAANSLPVTATNDFVSAPTSGNKSGWILLLNGEERVISRAFGLGGVIIFSTYTPDSLQPDSNGLCAFHGDSHNYVVYATNANPVAVVGGTATRYQVITGKFISPPFVEDGATKNSPASNPNTEQLDATQQGILKTLRKLYPRNTKFGNYWVSISGIVSDTSYARYAAIPIGITVKNWKEY